MRIEKMTGFVVWVAAFFLFIPFLFAGTCPPLAPPDGTVIQIDSEASLRNQAMNAAEGATLIVAAGTYSMGSFVHVTVAGLSIRGATGDRDDVILDFGGMTDGHFGVLVEADDVTIADLTIRNATDHGVSINGNDRPLLYNLHIVDINDQLVKVNPVGDGSQNGVLACSCLEYTTTAPNNYTNGISAHNAGNWVVRDNVWKRIRCLDDVPAPTILFWSGSSDTIVERNLLIDCYQGIAFGNAANNGPDDHTGGIVRNNMILGTLSHDVVIEMAHASNFVVAHNTALLLNPAPGQSWGMEARFSDTTGRFVNNLSNMAVWEDRDGAGATATNNVTSAAADWFVDAASGDLHLVYTATGAIDQGATESAVTDDYDARPRPRGGAPDAGADETGQTGVLTHLPLLLF